MSNLEQKEYGIEQEYLFAPNRIGQQLISEYFRGLLDAGFVQNYGDQQKILSRVAGHFGIEEKQLGIVDNEGHWKIIVRPEASTKVENRLFRNSAKDLWQQMQIKYNALDEEEKKKWNDYLYRISEYFEGPGGP